MPENISIRLSVSIERRRAMIIMMTVRQDFYVGVMAQLDSIKFTCQDHHWSRLKITGEKTSIEWSVRPRVMAFLVGVCSCCF